MDLTKNSPDWNAVEEIESALVFYPFDGLTVDDIREATWHGYDVSSPEGWASVDLVALGETTDGRWIAVEAWADTSGWDCRSGADWFVHPDRGHVIAQGLTERGRGILGLPLVLGGER